MAIPKITKQNIIDALAYIDENGVPFHNQRTKYELVSGEGKKYPPKYVVAVAGHLADGTDISTDGFNAVEAKNYLESQGFVIETKQQEKFELSITADHIEATDERFTMDNRFPVCKYKPDSELICGIYPGIDEFKKHRNTLEYLTYAYENGRQFVIYCWNIFSTILFVQECLKRFGEPGDEFILTCREKDEKEAD